MSPPLLLLLFFNSIGFIESATIGDGRTSLINGRPVDYRSGSCNVDGRTYASETSVPRENPCHYCICYAGRIDCYWKKCANIPAGCQAMDFLDTCNPSLYICDIPVNAREVPRPQPSVPSIGTSRDLLTSPQAATTTTTTTTYTPPAVPPVQYSIRPARQPVIVPPSRELTPPERQLIEPPTRHLTPPLKQASQRQLNPEGSGKQMPSQFGLRMKEKMRFSRSVKNSIHTGTLPHYIKEKFPFDFEQLVEEHIRNRRSINGSGFDNHHHHDHHHEEDRGCTILGVRYELGEVIGVATDVCQECRCAAQSLFCSPKCCFKPAPLQLAGDLIRSLEQATVDPAQASQHPLYYIQTEFA